MKTVGSKQSFAAGNGMVCESTRKVVECVTQESSAKVSGTGLKVAERLTADTVSTSCRFTNMPHPREVEEWDVTINLYCLQCVSCNEWLEVLWSFEQLYARAICMLRKKSMGLVDMEEIGKLSANF